MKCHRCLGQGHNPGDNPLSVNMADEVWNCHHCDWSGGLAGGVDNEGRPFKKAFVEKKYTIPLIRKPEPDKSESVLTVEAVKMLKARKIDPKTAIDAGIFATTRYFGKLKAEVPALCFPFVKNGTIVGAKYRPIDPTGFDETLKTFTQEENTEPVWWGLDSCKDADQVVIVEGEFDALAYRQAGYSSVLSVPAGSPKTLKEVTSKFNFFPSGEHIFEQASTVIIAIEHDGPGNIMAEEMARRIGKEKCLRVFFPLDCKDANDVLIKHGAPMLRTVTHQAPEFPTAGIVSPLELRNRVFHFKQHGLPPGYICGYPSLDDLYKALPGQTTITVGVPTHGKTTVIDSIMLGWARKNDWVIGIFTPENYPQELYMVNLLQKVKKKPFEQFTTEEVERGLEWMDSHIKIIQPDTPTITEIMARAEFLVKRDGMRALVIDPWTEVETESGFGTQNDFIKKRVTGLRQHGRDWDYHLYINVHPRKMTEEKDVDGVSRTGKPSAYDIMDSSHFANKADIIMSVWRDPSEDGSPIEVSVVKARQRRYARRGTMLFDYHPDGEYLTDGGFANDPYAEQRAADVESGRILEATYTVGTGSVHTQYPD
jgi:twinkle protein